MSPSTSSPLPRVQLHRDYLALAHVPSMLTVFGLDGRVLHQAGSESVVPSPAGLLPSPPFLAFPRLPLPLGPFHQAPRIKFGPSHQVRPLASSLAPRIKFGPSHPVRPLVKGACMKGACTLKGACMPCAPNSGDPQV